MAAEYAQNSSGMSIDLESKYVDDSRYKNFESNISKCLKASEQAREWADLISFLARLNKGLQAAPEQFTFVPHKHMVSRRLAQCLNASLPAGVHLKTIEVYQIIFHRIGPMQLRKDLYLYTMGLFPLFYYASINVKVGLFDLYEAHFLPLGEGLVPCLKGLILAVLPGLEEGSEFVPRCMQFLDALEKKIDPPLFYGTLWSCLLTTPNLRQYTVIYLNAKLKAQTAGDVSVLRVPHVLGEDRHLLAAALAAGLTDDNTLVLRGVLDFLVTLFPLHLQVFSEKDVIVVLLPALAVILKRDMSLNRRLYTWLLGPTSGSNRETDTEEAYFFKWSKGVLVSAMRIAFFTRPVDRSSALAPFKVLVVLAEKEEIGRHVVRELLVPVLRTLWVALEDGVPWATDVNRNSQQFFAMLDPSIVFTHLAQQIDVSDLRDVEPTINPQLDNRKDSATVGFVDGMQLLEFAMDVLQFKSGGSSSGVTMPLLMLLMIEKVSPSMATLSYFPHMLQANHVFKRMVECIQVDEAQADIQASIYRIAQSHVFSEHLIRERLAADLVDAEDFADCVGLFISVCDLVVVVAETLSRYGAYGKSAEMMDFVASTSSINNMGSINRASVASTPDTNVTARANPSTAGNHGNDGEEVAKGTKVLERTATGSDEEIEDDSVDITAASTGTKERSDPTGTAEAKEPTDTTATQSDTLTCTDTRLPTPPHSPQHTHTQQPQHPSTEQPRVHTQHSTEPPLHTTQPTHTPALTLTRPTAPEDTSAPIPQNQVQASGHAKPAEGQKGPPLNRANSTPHRSKDEIQVHTPVPGSPNTYKFRSAGGSPDPLHQSKGKELGLDQQNEFDEKALMRLAAERSLEAQKALVAVVEALMDCIQVRPWRAVVCATRAVLSVMSVAGSAVDLKPFQMQTSKKLWDWLDPSNGLKYEQSVELVNAFLALHTHVHTDMCERSICADLSHSHAHVRSRAASRFSSMWSVSEGLANKNGRVGLRRATLCMLDLINDEDLSTQLEARSWLSCALGTMASLLDPLLEILLHPTTHRRSAGQLTGAQRQVTLIYRRTPDNAQVEYALTTLMAMVSVDPSAFLFALCTSEVQPHHFAFHLYTAQKNSIGENAVASEPRSYFDLLLVAVLWFIQTDHVDQKPNGNYGNRARTDPAKRGSVSEKAGVSRRQQTHRQPQNSRLQVLSTQLLHKLLHQARLPAHTSNQYRTLSAYIGPSASTTRLSNEDTSNGTSTNKNRDPLRIYTHTAHTLMQRPEVYDNMVVTHLDEIENVVLGRLHAVVTPKQLELQVALMQLLQSVVVLDNMRLNAESSGGNHSNASGNRGNASGWVDVPSGKGKADRKVRNHTIAQNPLFLDTILIALNMPSLRAVHAYWITYVLACLPHTGSHLDIIVPAVLQCLSTSLAVNAFNSTSSPEESHSLNTVPWHSVTMLEGIGAILHYCLSWCPIKIKTITPGETPSSDNGGAGAATQQILSNFMQMFGAEGGDAHLSLNEDVTNTNVMKAFDGVLDPLAAVWTALNLNMDTLSDSRHSGGVGADMHGVFVDSLRKVPKVPNIRGSNLGLTRRRSMALLLASGGAAKKQRQRDITRERILEILEMVFVRHPYRLVESFMLTWKVKSDSGHLFVPPDSDRANEYSDTTPPTKDASRMRSDSAQNLKPGAKVSPNLQCRVRITDSQQALVDMLLQLGRDGRFRFLIQGIREIHTRSNSNSTHASAPLSIIKIAHRNEALLLQMLLCCTEQCDTAAVSDALGSILQLLGEITSSTNYLPSTSVCLVIIYTLATKLKSSMDHRHRRRLQELSYRLVSIMINSVTLSIGRESTLAANQTEVESKKLGQGAAGSAPGGATQSSTSPRSWPASRQVSDSGINSQSSTNQNTARQTPINEKLGTRLPTPGTKSTRSAAVSPPASSAAADYDPVGEALVVLRVYVMGTLNALHQKTEKDRVTLYLQPVMPSLAPLLKAGNHVSYKYKQELLQLFLSISTYAYALRSWKTAIYDLFMDTNYFKIKQGLIPSWRFLIKNMCALDKHVLTDIIEQTKTSSGQSTLNIFSSQAQELDSKSRLVKRTAFVIYCGTQDEYYQDIPAIMECIVDCLRPPSSPVVQERVFLLFRIMLLRMSEQHLLAWWPTALTEVVRVLDRALTQCRNHGNGPLASASAMNRNSTSSLRTSPVTTKRSMGHMDLFTPDDLHLLLGACKFVDLMILLPVQICHLHQWMFVDEIIHEAPNTPTPQSQLSVPTKPNNPTTQAPADRDLGVFASYMARLSDALSDGISPDIGASGVELADFEHGARGPLLTMREVSSASDLVPFFSTVSAFNIAADVTRSIPDYASIQAIIDIEFTEAS